MLVNDWSRGTARFDEGETASVDVTAFIAVVIAGAGGSGYISENDEIHSTVKCRNPLLTAL